jgi:hypothetical protein
VANDESLDNGPSERFETSERKRLLIVSARIFGSSVDRGIRSHAAVPEGPKTRHRSRAGIPDDRLFERSQADDFSGARGCPRVVHSRT